MHVLPLTHAAPVHAAHRSGSANETTPATAHAQQCTGKRGAGREPIFRTPQKQEKHLRPSPSPRAGCVCKMRDIWAGAREGGEQSLATITTHSKINLKARQGLRGVVQLPLCVSVVRAAGRGGERRRQEGKSSYLFSHPAPLTDYTPLPKLRLPPLTYVVFPLS